MTDPVPVDLIDLADEDGNRCIVRVTGRFKSGDPMLHDILRADVLVFASFVDARLDVYLSPHDLDAWQEELSALAPGRDASIGGDRGLTLGFHLHEDGWLSITVDDPGRLITMIGARPEENWISDHHERLEQVRRTWPVEVVETAPGVYEWSADRGR
ncbi:DUF5959 family protein [Streptomyces sp. NRRL S-350]|uniref:DUF5959 family protein n=1 Tax=Streptomyces sp. NRRL S-350 TaxID=1463902 RepID=UPI0004BE93B1